MLFQTVTGLSVALVVFLPIVSGSPKTFLIETEDTELDTKDYQNAGNNQNKANMSSIWDFITYKVMILQPTNRDSLGVPIIASYM